MRFFRKKKAQRLAVDGAKLDNPDELARYELLLLRWKAGEISKPEVHPHFPIEINGDQVCMVILDFQYWDYQKQQLVVEDCKPAETFIRKQTKKGIVVRQWKEKRPHIEGEAKLKIRLVESLYEIQVEIICPAAERG